MSNGSDTSYTLAYNHRITGIAAYHNLLETAEKIPSQVRTVNTDTAAMLGGRNRVSINP
jgi:hypothetical protein